MKELARRLGVLQLYRQLRYGHQPGKKKQLVYPWAGNYKDWQTAKNIAGDYSNPHILEKVLEATLAVKTGRAVYERDSVLFEHPQYPEDLIRSLQLIAQENDGDLEVVDFGGSLGSSYFQTRSQLTAVKQLQWKLVEQPHFVAAGNQYIKDDQLRFYPGIAEAGAGKNAVLLLSGVIQYLPDPIAFLQEQVLNKFTWIIVDRTAFIEDSTARITVQHVPKEIYDADYPAWFFPEEAFLDLFRPHYEILSSFKSFAEPDLLSEDGKKMYWNGYLFRLKTA